MSLHYKTPKEVLNLADIVIKRITLQSIIEEQLGEEYISIPYTSIEKNKNIETLDLGICSANNHKL